MNGLDILLRQLSVEKFINLYGSKAEYSIIALVNTSKLKKKNLLVLLLVLLSST